MTLLIQLFLLSCFFPFVSPIPLNSDVQPLPLILGVSIIFFRLGNRQLERLKLASCILIFLISISFILLLAFPYAESIDAVRKSSGLLQALVIYVVFSSGRVPIGSRTTLYSSIVYLFFSIGLLLNAALFSVLQFPIVRTIKVLNYGLRGSPALAAEPSFTALACFTIAYVSFLLYSTSTNCGDKRRYLASILISSIVVFLTLSGSALVLGLLTLSAILAYLIKPLFAAKVRLKFIYIVLIVFALVTIFLPMFPSSRIVRLVNSLLSSIAILDLNPLLSDVSLGKRVSQLTDVLTSNAVSGFFLSPLALMNSFPLGNILTFALVAFFLFNSNSLYERLLLIFFFVSSISIAFPAIWLILGYNQSLRANSHKSFMV